MSDDARSTLASLSAALADHYRIVREIGAGGMATVYLAEDLKHRRQVAVKVLRSDLAASLGATRFVREVSIAANLQHPHILPLYDSGQAGEFLYYVMPFVEGTSLRDKLAREGELPIPDAVRILRDVADAMAYAHAHAVVHRDIKPENVMLSGRHALVTDFGVAKAVSEATGAHQLTTVGIALGTPTYMAPEQATADPHTDHRADIYAWGVMAYELLAGRPPFAGPTPQSVLAAHVTAVPDPVTTHRAAIPASLAALIMKALEKKPADRWQSAQELISPLEALLTPSGGVAAAETVHAATGQRGKSIDARSRSSRWAAPALLLLGGLAVGVAVGRRGGSSNDSALAGIGVLRFTLEANSPQLDPAFGQLPRIALSTDGRALVYGEGSQLYVRDLSSFDSRPLEGTEDAVAPAFSPDGQWVVFGQRGLIRKMPTRGGQVVDVATANFRLGAHWALDDWIYFSAGLGDRGIWRASASGGAVEQVTQLSDSTGEQAHGWPQVLPNGRDLLYTVLGTSGGGQDSRIVVETMGSGRRETLVEHSAFARHVAGGYIVYSDLSGAVFAVRYDARARKVKGAPIPVLEERVSTAVWGGHALFAISGNGVLVYVPETGHDNHLLVSVDRNGGDARAVIGPANLRGAAVAPGGRQVAISLREPGRNDVWLAASNGSSPERLTLDLAEDEMPVWAPDGRRLVYRSAWAGQKSRLMVTDVVARSTPTVLRVWSRHVHPTGWSPDGKWLASFDYHPTNNEDIWAIGVGSTDSIAVAVTAAREQNAVFSPDGRWLAYESWESGRAEVYVTRFPSLSGRRQLSSGGGSNPRWDPRGNRLLFLQATRLVEVPVRTGDELAVLGPAATLFDIGRSAYEFELAADGRYLLMLPNEARTSEPIHVVLDWVAALGPPPPR